MPVVPMAHVPRRATQHGLYVSGEETAPPALKPGQHELMRHGLYATVCGAAGDRGDSFLTLDRFSESEYAKSQGRNTRPEHYLEYKKADNRWAARTLHDGPEGTAHWRSEYNSTLNGSVVERANDDRAWGSPRSPYGQSQSPNSTGRAEDLTSYHADFGRYGSNPRDRIPPGATKLPIFKTVLNAGTTKVTDHVPGYQGHIPMGSARGERCVERSVDKTNVVEIFHTNLVGYAGHVPMSARNDRGGRQLTTETVSGRDFVPFSRRVSKQ